ncbi:VWA domain-containing protein [Defluviimonas sp. WL0024]|uniref:VWA domain-containing protein n=1 Tax=Albidovulum salinarum TaxID=2984153 RepID=A0ABT2X674_9RHOB|nr:VWA domain-containing protein [Defluviimonas sp. WL0024]MCU9849447.1 VWA domain-containing protein [Defluviimonas sp. WL0024]
MIQLALPWALILLPLPYLVWRFAPPYRRHVEALRFPFFRRIAEAAGAEPKPGAVVLARSRLQMAAAVIVWALVVLALARPERVGAPVERVKAARDVVLAIDISGSMDIQDFQAPDGERLQRLAAVKQVVAEFLAGREGDRAALIVFGSKAYVQAPLTEDLDTVSGLLAQTSVGMAGPHTALGDAIGLAIRTFEASEIEQRLLILLSDGSDTASAMSPVNAAEIAASRGVEIYSIGVGDPAARGEARVDLGALRDIAARTGGAYFFADDVAALGTVYDRIDTLAPRETETLSYRPRQSLAHWPLGLAALIALGAVAVLHLRPRLGAGPATERRSA